MTEKIGASARIHNWGLTFEKAKRYREAVTSGIINTEDWRAKVVFSSVPAILLICGLPLLAFLGKDKGTGVAKDPFQGKGDLSEIKPQVEKGDEELVFGSFDRSPPYTLQDTGDD